VPIFSRPRCGRFGADRTDAHDGRSWCDVYAAGLICDRDRKWSHDVRRQLPEAGIREVLIPARAPNANEDRFVRSIKEECLNRLIPIGERHYRRAVWEYVEHYHRERNHQGLDNRLISDPPAIPTTSRVRRCPRLGGLANFNGARLDRQIGRRTEQNGRQTRSDCVCTSAGTFMPRA